MLAIVQHWHATDTATSAVCEYVVDATLYIPLTSVIIDIVFNAVWTMKSPKLLLSLKLLCWCGDMFK